MKPAAPSEAMKALDHALVWASSRSVEKAHSATKARDAIAALEARVQELQQELQKAEARVKELEAIVAAAKPAAPSEARLKRLLEEATDLRCPSCGAWTDIHHWSNRDGEVLAALEARVVAETQRADLASEKAQRFERKWSEAEARVKELEILAGIRTTEYRQAVK